MPDIEGIDGSAVEGAEERGAALDPDGFSLFEPTLDESEGTGVKADRAGAVAAALERGRVTGAGPDERVWLEPATPTLARRCVPRIH